MSRILSSLLILTFTVAAFGQTETPPAPSAPRISSVPPVFTSKLSNGLVVATVKRTSSPLVTIEFMTPFGAMREGDDSAGLADFTASMLTKGTKNRTATEIAEEVEFLGGGLFSGSTWNNSKVGVTVTSDKIEAAFAILADVVRNPKFDPKEVSLLRQQTLDGLNYNLKQAGFLASYVSATTSFGEHPAGGTPTSIARIKPADVAAFYRLAYRPETASVVFSGDIDPAQAKAIAQKFFGTWKVAPVAKPKIAFGTMPPALTLKGRVSRITVVDLPDSGQAAVNFNVRTSLGRLSPNGKSETAPAFYPAMVLNSILGGGYSSRLNQEIRIKRGLSYGAGSSFAWRNSSSNFSARVQTKNESAGEVASLIVAEIDRISTTPVPATELGARKLVLSGDFGRETETTAGLAEYIVALLGYGLTPNELKTHIARINAVGADRVQSVAANFLDSGDIVIVGDYKVFKDDLAKRFPGMKIEVVPASKYTGDK